MKKCSRCKSEKELSEFHLKNREKLQYHGHCKDCQRAYVRSHYLANVDYYVRKANKNNRKYRRALDDLKEQPCTDCGVRYPHYVMDYDHIRGEKVGNVSAMRYKGQKKLALAEIKKCELVCSNCHRIRTFNRRKQH
ncbi:MAG: hypothetical protein EBU46_11605 [Nitrosomonadaceae bacterium]|nr:hypothetical protein [Nitrosomonadaceae bacterium]